MTSIKIALDWTPNINHIGIFVAREMGFYREEKIDLQILNPADDNYNLTPGKKLEMCIADFAVAPFETVISLNNKLKSVNAIAVFAILKEDLSSIATLSSVGINRPKDLDGKIYASYKARYEDHIVKELIKNDGGSGDIQFIYPDKLGIWNTLLQHKADATWIFNNWEGIEAASKNIPLNKFQLTDFDIPYCYSPVIITEKNNIITSRKEYEHFIKATKNGYQFAIQNKLQAVNILKEYVTKYDLNNIDLMKSLEVTAPYFGTENDCGEMQRERVEIFLKWLVKNNLENDRILLQNLFTNELIH
ncbi:MAG: ABC transporter substrate-binding protein [Opitutaceae bacterium]|nr:ABC transporter substrate-binding protein [Cytophagales bacterium]